MLFLCITVLRVLGGWLASICSVDELIVSYSLDNFWETSFSAYTNVVITHCFQVFWFSEVGPLLSSFSSDCLKLYPIFLIMYLLLAAKHEFLVWDSHFLVVFFRSHPNIYWHRNFCDTWVNQLIQNFWLSIITSVSIDWLLEKINF